MNDKHAEHPHTLKEPHTHVPGATPSEDMNREAQDAAERHHSDIIEKAEHEKPAGSQAKKFEEELTEKLREKKA